jgi:thiol-disulfide isomerase/thioredoxin
MRIGPAVWQHFATAGEDERKVFIIAAGVVCFLTFRALRRREPTPEPERAEIEWDDAGEAPTRPTTPAPPLDPELQRILQAGIGWPIETKAPEFTLLDITGQERSLQSLREQGKTICLLFLSPHCEPCRALWPHIGRWAREHDRALNIFVISRGTSAETLAKQNAVDGSRVLLQREFELSEGYGVTATPAAVLVGPNGLIRSALAVGREDIEKLISSSALGSTTLGEASPKATSSI